MNEEDKVYSLIDGIYYDAGTEADLVNDMNAKGVEGFEITEVAPSDGDSVYGEDGNVLTVHGSSGELYLGFDADDFQDESTVERFGRLGIIF